MEKCNTNPATFFCVRFHNTFTYMPNQDIETIIAYQFIYLFIYLFCLLPPTQGAQGPPGQRGGSGDPGPNGNDGADGPPGSQGPPVRRHSSHLVVKQARKKSSI